MSGEAPYEYLGAVSPEGGPILRVYAVIDREVREYGGQAGTVEMLQLVDFVAVAGYPSPKPFWFPAHKVGRGARGLGEGTRGPDGKPLVVYCDLVPVVIDEQGQFKEKT